MSLDTRVLRDASIKIGKAALVLDTSEETCACCGVIKKNNWKEHQAFKELDAIRVKLNNIAHRLESE